MRQPKKRILKENSFFHRNYFKKTKGSNLEFHLCPEIDSPHLQLRPE